MPDERIGCRKCCGAALGVSTSALARFLSWYAVTGMAEKSEGGAITRPVKPSPWFARLRDGRRSLRTEDWPRVDLLIVLQNQLFSKQLLAAAGSGEYVVYTAILANVGLFYGGDFATLLAKVDPGFEGRARITRCDNECRWDPAERFFTRDSAVMVLPINGNITLECGQDLYDEMDLEAPPESWDDVAAVANIAQKRYDGDVYCCLGCGARGANAASYDRQTQ